MKPPPDRLITPRNNDQRYALVTALATLAIEVAADQRWAEQAIEGLKDQMRQEIRGVRVLALWPLRPLRENMIREINLIKARALMTVEHVREFREHLIREARMLPLSKETAGRPFPPTGLEMSSPVTLNSALAQTEMELRVRWNMARSRALPGLLD
jgi:hypothetical protein